jgi:hypothetical protein
VTSFLKTLGKSALASQTLGFPTGGEPPSSVLRQLPGLPKLTLRHRSVYVSTAQVSGHQLQAFCASQSAPFEYVLPGDDPKPHDKGFSPDG